MIIHRFQCNQSYLSFPEITRILKSLEIYFTYIFLKNIRIEILKIISNQLLFWCCRGHYADRGNRVSHTIYWYRRRPHRQRLFAASSASHVAHKVSVATSAPHGGEAGATGGGGTKSWHECVEVSLRLW